jgi:hypothetical protein
MSFGHIFKMLLIIKDRHFVRGCKTETSVNHNNRCRHDMMFWTYDFVTDRFTQISCSGNSSFFIIVNLLNRQTILWWGIQKYCLFKHLKTQEQTIVSIKIKWTRWSGVSQAKRHSILSGCEKILRSNLWFIFNIWCIHSFWYVAFFSIDDLTFT